MSVESPLQLLLFGLEFQSLSGILLKAQHLISSADDFNLLKSLMRKSIQPPFESSSLNPPPPPGTVKDEGGVIKFFQYLFVLVSMTTLVTFVVWIVDSQETEVVSSQPIGHFMSMSGPGGLSNGVVIETEVGSYPLLRDAPVISKGTALVLEVRASGNRYICDTPRSLCVLTADKEFKPSAQATN